MNRASLSFVQTFLRNTGIVPRKSFSQNFLIDANVAKKIVDQARLTEHSIVIEVGPGLGALSEWILKKTSHVTLVEKDPNLLPALETLDPLPLILNEDILTIDWHHFFPKQGKVQVISNLPYHISKEFIQKLYEYRKHIDHCLVLVQKEFAEKLLSPSNQPEYRFITVFCRLFTKVVSLFDIPPHLFYPHAGIDSRLIKLDFKATAPSPLSMKLLELSFTHRRKAIVNSLKGSDFSIEKIGQILKSMGKATTTRAEELSPDEWAELLESYLHS